MSLHFDPARASVGLVGISVPGELDFNGVQGAGALKDLAAGVASVKGTASFSVPPIQAYTGTLLATFLLTDRSLAPGTTTPLGFPA